MSYFLSIGAKNGIKSHKLFKVASCDTNPSFSPTPDGLLIWQTEDTWHLEATGDRDGSHFTGKIIANSPIKDLALYKLESSDRVEFADNSHKIIEFDLRVWEKWIDGISFKVTDGTSLFLDLNDNNDISVKAGSNLQETMLVSSQ
ncbi:MAG: hypothetical protein HC930_10025 [Hydrococcus sp. SU_1_0]|nr:hypothetical protein [Hydrococcus sp. SU_1_0]NJO98814.1 hypothetical protein [Pleurocapsa sp. CRU_1_2]